MFGLSTHLPGGGGVAWRQSVEAGTSAAWRSTAARADPFFAAIPARHREGLAGGGGRIVITADHGGCLLVYPQATWEPIQAELMGLSSFDDRIRSVQRLLVGHADDVELDAAGRILVPPALRRYAGLDKRVVLVGQGQKLELWDEVKWQAQVAQTITFAGGLPDGLQGLSL